MRRISAFALAIASLAAAGCTTARPPQEVQKVQTTAEANRDTIQGAAEAPLRDLNVLRTKIPPALLDALVDTYARPPKTPRMSKAQQCEQLVKLVQPLDEALGADLDNPDKEDQSLIYRGRETALGMMAGAASDVIPFRSWVRKLTGAEQHDRLVQNAITAGAIRRAYLKGLGESRGCNPPATPSHILTESAAQRPPPRDRFMPLYPIRR